jgi:actin-related protein
MNEHDLDRHDPAVVSLCEAYLQEDADAMMLLNRILNLVANFALIDELSADNDEFDYAAEIEELVWAAKNLNNELERNDLLSMSDYATQLQEKEEEQYRRKAEENERVFPRNYPADAGLYNIQEFER